MTDSCKVSDICNDVIAELSMVPGVNTQIYGTPKIQQQLQGAIIMMMDEEWWPSHRQYFYNVALDGINGRITSDLVSTLTNHTIRRYQDIEAVYPATLNRPLRALPPRFNPATLTGSNSIYLVPNSFFPLRPFSVLPVTAADALTVVARAYPLLPIGLTDLVYLDRLLLTYLTAYLYSEDDGTNPGAIAKFKNLFEKRLSQVKAGWEEHSIPLDPRFATTEYEWSERE